MEVILIPSLNGIMNSKHVCLDQVGFVFICRYEKNVCDIEAIHCLRVRWLPTDPLYIEGCKQLSQAKCAQLRHSMWVSVVRRRFLLQMKAKYAGIR